MTLSDKKPMKVLEDARPVLMDGEEVIDATTGVAHVTRMGKKTIRRATILVTDRRVIIFSKKLGGYDVQDYAYGLLTGVDHKAGFSFGHLTIRASGDTADVQQVQKDDVGRVAQSIRNRMATSMSPAAQPAPTNPSASVADELAKLGGLRDQGILSEEEFSAAKGRLLSP